MTLIERALLLSWFTIAYNLVEGAVSVYFGVSDDSMALAGFGADSFIEVFSAALVLWRFRAEAGVGAGLAVERERRATLGIGILFVLLAGGAAAGALAQLRAGGRPETTVPGLVIAAASLSFMFYLWRAKREVAKGLDSCTVLKDADCSLACIKLSVVLLAGSLLFMAAPALWWSDAAAALVLAVLIAREGVLIIRAARKPEFAGGCGCA
ncbi:MAG: heavy metal transporter [Elusimicrobiota bacterium]|nr:heavy metal transporter [Elusimicrobiota bacterium]